MKLPESNDSAQIAGVEPDAAGPAPEATFAPAAATAAAAAATAATEAGIKAAGRDGTSLGGGCTAPSMAAAAAESDRLMGSPP